MKKKLCYVLLLLFILFPLNIFAEKSIDIKNVDEVKQYYINLVPKIEGINKQESESIITEINKCQTPSLVKGCVEDYVFKDIDKIKGYEVVKSNKKFSECKEIFDILEYALTEDVKAVEEMEKMDLLTLDYVNGKIKLFNQIYKEFVEKYNKYKKAGLNNAPLIIDNLKNGEYVVDLSIYNDITGQMLGRRLPEPKLSMMDDAVYKLGKIVVKDGKKELIIKMIPLHQKLSGLHFSGYLLNLKVKDKHEKFNPASVDSRYEDYEDSLLKEFRKDANERYPKVIRLPLDNMETKTWEMYRDFKTKKNIEKYKELYNKKYTDAKSIQVRVFVPIMEHIQKDMGDQFAKPTIFTNSIEKYNPGNRDTLKNKIATVNINKYKDNSNKDKVDELKKILEKAKVASDSFILTDEEVQEYINKIDNLVKTLDADTQAPLKKEALTKEIEEAKKVEQGKKTDEAFNALKAAIKSAEEVLSSASEQTAIDGAVNELNKAIQTFNSSQDKKVELNKTALDAKIKDADKISQGKKSEDAFKTLKAAIEAAKNILNSANTQEQINEALTNLNKAIDAFNNSADVTVTPEIREKVYTIPVKLMHLVQNKESMGNKALISPAKVSIKGNDVNIDLTFKGIEVPLGTNKFYGHLTNLFSYKDNILSEEAIEAEVLERVEDNAMDGFKTKFPKVFRIKLTKDAFDNLKDNTLYVKVWVDAMDSIAGRGPGSGEQNARVVFDKSKMTEDKPGGEVPTPTPNVPNREAVIDALRRYSNLGGPQYTYQSNMRYVNAYNSLMGLLSKSIVTESELKSAIDELKSAVTSLTLDTSKPNNSGNNNQGWGNNSGWGNNNSSWGSYGNNNQGWNNNSSWGVYNNQNNNKNNGPVTIQYEVPVEVIHAHENRYSMANGAINHTARVEERNGQFRYSVQFGPMQREFAGKTFIGNLYNLFIYDGSKYQAEQSSGNVWSWVMNGKYDKVKIAVWVDAMDEIAGKGQGGGEQDAILSFNWNNAREVGRVGGNNNNQNQQNQQNQNQQKQAPQVVQNNSASNNFTDTSGHWAKTAIDYVVSKGYFAGLSNTEFGPNKSITRGQFVSVLGRMLKVNVNDYKDQNFKDVKSGMYYSPYITWANKVGIVSGVGQGNFAPDKELTREEMAVMMTKFLKVSGKNLNAKGNTNGFKDEEKIQGWAKDSVKEMARLGIVSGMGDGSFAPKSQFTRAQVAQVLYNIDHN